MVIPDILSKKAFVKENSILEKTNGREPKIAMLNHDNEVNKNACCKCYNSLLDERRFVFSQDGINFQ